MRRIVGLAVVAVMLIGMIGANVWGAVGDVLWTFKTDDMLIESTAAISDEGNIFICSHDGNLYALNENGTLAWKYHSEGPVESSPTINVVGKVYFGSYDNYFYAINPDGTLFWKFKTGHEIRTSSAIDGNGIIYFGSHDTYLYAINPDGTEKWKFKTDREIFSTPAIDANGTIYFGSYDSYLYALNSDGSGKWKFELGEGTYSSPTIDSYGNIYIGCSDGKVYSLTPDGTLNWMFPTDSIVGSTPIIGVDGTIYVGSDDSNMYAINADGSMKWKFQTGDVIDVSVVLDTEGNIYFGSYDGWIYALSADGSLLWKVQADNEVRTSGTITDSGVLLIGSRDTNLYAISTGTTSGLSVSPWPKFQRDLRNTSSMQEEIPVVKSIILTSPNGGETLIGGTVHDFTWNAQGVVDVNLQWRKNDDDRWILIENDIPPEQGSYQWTVPTNVESEECRVRISGFTTDALSPVVLADVSETYFTIKQVEYTIAFASNRDGDFEIFGMADDGTNLTQLTDNTALDNFPSWSSDGSLIAFTSDRDGDNEIYVMDRYGANQTRITNNPANDMSPVFSPDGTQITFASNRDGTGDIYVMSADGSNVKRLTTAAQEYNPDWSPDGSQIVFGTNRLGNSEIFVMNTDGSNQKNISNNSSPDYHPRWSSDGSKIAFHSHRSGNASIYIMNTDGSKQIDISNNSVKDIVPDWSQDDSQIVFFSIRDGNNEIYVMNADGSGQINISNNPADDSYPTWLSGGGTQTPVISLTSPNGGEKLSVGQKHAITWASENVSTVKIDYSLDSGTIWTEIVASTVASTVVVASNVVSEGTYEWTVPDVQSSECLVRISSATDETVYGQSDAVFTIKQSLLTMVSIPGGSFLMGDISGAGESNERPLHTVTLTGFEMSAYEITQALYQSVTGSNPSSFSGTNLPVEQVTWYDAVQFCNALSKDAGLMPCYDESTWECDFSVDGFRLPTEAEWEFACRAGTETEYYTGNNESDLGEAGWYYSNSSLKTHPVGQKTANAFGLYDMYGNVWEWCNGWYGSDYYNSSPSDNPTGPASGTSREGRGGSWNGVANSCRSAYRNGAIPTHSNRDMGFRVARGTFTITPLTLTSPNGGEKLSAGQKHAITWANENVSTVKIDYSLDNGTNWTEIVASTVASAGAYVWTVPDMPSSECLVRIADTANASVTDKSDGLFTIITSQIIFLDPNLEAALREALVKPTGVLTADDLAGLTDFDASEREISDLTGIEYCVNLDQLDLNTNLINDLSPLNNLTSLLFLNLDNNQIINLSPLSSLTDLLYLDMDSNQISDLSPLSSLTNLQNLHMFQNQISDIGPLSGLTIVYPIVKTKSMVF